MDLVIFKGLKGAKITVEALNNAVVDAIERNILKPGDKLPSSRDIAQYLSISRTTVVKAFDILIGTGHLTSNQGAGTWVNALPARGSKHTGSESESQSYRWPVHYSQLAERLTNLRTGPLADHMDLTDMAEFDEANFGSAPLDLMPLRAWREILLRNSKSLGKPAFAANKEVFGYRPLREAIAGFLRRSKGIVCGAEQIVLHSGVQSVVSPVFDLLVKPSDLAVCENPGFWGARAQFKTRGAEIFTVPVDEDGLIVDALDNIVGKPQWLYLAPSCQEPTGVSLSLARRNQLLNWCNNKGTAILEDDWDSEFHYGGAVAPPLFSLDATGSVIYFYSFWRLLYPLVSVGFLVLPVSLIPLFETFMDVWDRQFTLIEHYVLTELINDGHVEKQIRTLWKNYRKRRQSLIFALTTCLGPKVGSISSSTGMHLQVRFSLDLPAERIQRSALEAGLPIASTRPFYDHSAHPNEFLIRFASVPADEIDDRVRLFSQCLG